MALVIIIDSMDSMTIEEHAKESVKRMMVYTDPFAPRLPEKADVYMRHYCEEGHQYWAPMDRRHDLCPEHMDAPDVREKHGYGGTQVHVSLVQADHNGQEAADGDTYFPRPIGT